MRPTDVRDRRGAGGGALVRTLLGLILLAVVGCDARTSPANQGATAVSAGYEHTCGLKTDGAVACWGRKTVGLLKCGSRPVYADQCG